MLLVIFVFKTDVLLWNKFVNTLLHTLTYDIYLTVTYNVHTFYILLFFTCFKFIFDVIIYHKVIYLSYVHINLQKYQLFNFWKGGEKGGGGGGI